MTWYKDDNDYVPATIINGKKIFKKYILGCV